MRVLWLSHLVPYPPKGGTLQRSYNLMHNLAHGHDVKLLCFNQRALLPTRADVQQAVAALSEFVDVLDVIDIPSNSRTFGRELLAATSYVTGRAYTIEWLRSREYRAAVAKAVSDHSPDLLHFDTISLAQYRDLAGNRPCVLNHHNIESMMMERRAELEPKPLQRHYYTTEARRLRRYESRHAADFDLHLTCSALDAERLHQIAGNVSVEVVPNGVDLEYFRPALDAVEEPHSMIFAGGLTWYPNLSAVEFLTQRVWPLVRAEFPDAVLTIIGKSPPNWLRELAKSDARVRVTGFVDDVRPYMDRASVYVCPIFDGGGTKLKVLDALAMGKPLVANPIAVEGIDAVPEKHWLAADTPEEFLKAIRRLFGDAALRHSLSENARRLIADTYSFAEIGRRLAQKYELLGARGSKI